VSQYLKDSTAAKRFLVTVYRVTEAGFIGGTIVHTAIEFNSELCGLTAPEITVWYTKRFGFDDPKKYRVSGGWIDLVNYDDCLAKDKRHAELKQEELTRRGNGQ
jgi:hypothetical protein